jgi:hypothetical protein
MQREIKRLKGPARQALIKTGLWILISLVAVFLDHHPEVADAPPKEDHAHEK